jgi:cysteine-S-conjugate beta-lyase
MHYNFDEVVNRTETASVKYDLCKWVFGRKDVIPLWVADMDFRTPPFIMDALRKRMDHDILGYTYITPSFYESIIQWNLRRHQWQVKKDWISFSPGIVPAINLLIMAFTKPGDRIVIQPPVYFPFFTAIKNHNRALVENPLKEENGSYAIDFDDLERKTEASTRMLILSNPHNPTGNVWSPEILRKVADLCLKKNILLVSDEIHSDLLFPGQKHTPVARISSEIAENTITCMSASKTFNLAGLSTAYLIIPNVKLRQQYEETLDHIHVGAGNIFGFVAAEAAYTYGDEWLEQLRHYLAENFRYLDHFLKREIPQIKALPPQATYLVWLDCRELNLSPDALKDFMIHEAGLGMNEGRQFGKEGEGFMRINIGCPRSILTNALQNLKNAVQKSFAK